MADQERLSASLRPSPDCWTEEDDTYALIEAWGDRYLALNRGSLRQKHWQEVADAVNSLRRAAITPLLTDVECKNRIETLKKKYKCEKSKILGSNKTLTSKWLFYTRLDALIGYPSTILSNKPSETPRMCKESGRRRRRREVVDVWRELAKAVERFGEMYERVEMEKQQQVVELERERMDFVESLEYETMQLFMDTPMQMEKKIKRAKRESWLLGKNCG